MWPVVKAHLKRVELPVTRGFDELQARLLEEIRSASDDGEKIKEQMMQFLHEYHLHGEKQITFFRVRDQVTSNFEFFEQEIEKGFLAFETQNSDAFDAFPFTLLENSLGDGDSVVTLVSKNIGERYIDLVFSTTITGDVKELYSPSNVDDLPDSWKTSEQIIVVRKRVTQVLPVVSFDKTNKIIQVKIPIMGSFAVEDVIRNNVINAISQLLRQRIEAFPGVFRMLNLYPAISKIYLNEGEGKVIELGFFTDTKSAKLERMKSDDLRKELWHGAGKAALQALSPSSMPFVPFRLAVRWDFEGDDVELVLPGSTRTLISQPYTLHHAKISGTVELQQFHSCIDTLLKYVQ